ncbi:MAG: response regulator [bacterium]
MQPKSVEKTWNHLDLTWKNLQHDWLRRHAASLDDLLNIFCEETEQIGDMNAWNSAFAMQIYLSSFIDGDIKPNAEQMHKLSLLMDDLRSQISLKSQQKPDASDPSVTTFESTIRKHLLVLSKTLWVDKLEHILDEHSYALSQAKQLTELLDQLEQATPDVILIDQSFSADLEPIVRKARTGTKNQKRVPIIVISQSSDINRRVQALKAGVDAYIVKPESARTILTKINEMILADQASAFKVLIVDDDESQAYLCDSVLRNSGMITQVVMDNSHLEEQLINFSPDIILMDLYMPGRNGLELAAVIRENEQFSTTPIIFISGEADPEKRIEAIALGADDFLIKPIRPRHLISLVEARCARARKLNRKLSSTQQVDMHTGLVSFDTWSDAINHADQTDTVIAIRLMFESKLHQQQLSEEYGTLFAAQLNTEHVPCALGWNTWSACIPEIDNPEGLIKRIARIFKGHIPEHVNGNSPTSVAIIHFKDPNTHNDPEQLRATLQQKLNETLRNSSNNSPVVNPSKQTTLNYIPATELNSLISIAGTVQELEAHFQAVIPIHSNIQEQFLLIPRIVRTGTTDRLIHYSDIELTATKNHILKATDKRLIQLAIIARQNSFSKGQQIRVLVPQSLSSVTSADYESWLLAELRSNHQSTTGIEILLFMNSNQISDHQREQIDDLQKLGMKCILVTQDVSNQPDIHFDGIYLEHKKKNPVPDWLTSIKQHGKNIIINDLDCYLNTRSTEINDCNFIINSELSAPRAQPVLLKSK